MYVCMYVCIYIYLFIYLCVCIRVTKCSRWFFGGLGFLLRVGADPRGPEFGFDNYYFCGLVLRSDDNFDGLGIWFVEMKSL